MDGKKKTFSKITGIIVGATLLFTTTPAAAEDLHSTLRQQQEHANSLQNEIEATTDQIVELENQIAASQRKIDEKIGEILETVHKIEELEDEILTIEAEMELTKREIEEKEIEIAGLVENQERRVEILKTRARALQNKIAPILSLILF